MGFERPSAPTVAAAGSVVAPANGAAVVTIGSGSLPSGSYRVIVKAGYGATADVLNGMELRKGGTSISALAIRSTTNVLEEFVFERIDLDGASALTVNALQAGAAGSVYIAMIKATKWAT